MPNHELSPWYQWYPRDFLSSAHVRAMNYEEKGVYRELLDTQWMEGGIPADLDELCDILQLTRKKFDTIWKKVGRCFEVAIDDPTVLRQAKIEKIRAEMIEASEKKKKAGSEGGKAKARREAERAEKLGKSRGETLAKLQQNPSIAIASLEQPHSIAVASLYHADADANTEITSSVGKPTTDEPAASAPALPGIDEERKKDDLAEWTAPSVPDDMPDVWPERGKPLKLLAQRFLVAFGNCHTKAAQAKHGPAYVDALSAISSRVGVTPLDAWLAFGYAQDAHNGKPLFGSQAKTAMSYLPKRATPNGAHPAFKQQYNALVNTPKPQLVTPEFLAAML
jgi:uncharacterized protein YdaU (DUF1376 family)